MEPGLGTPVADTPLAMLRTLSRFLLASLPVLALGCSASNPDDIPEIAPDAGEDVTPGVVNLRVDDPVVKTPWPTVMITGRGPSKGTLLISSTARGEDSQSIPASGDFCVDVPLGEGDNKIKFEAIDADGNYSDPIFVSVSREGELPGGTPTPIEGPGISDRTAGTSYYDNADGDTVGGVSLVEGAWADLVDNNKTNLVRFEGGWLNNEAVAYKLPKKMNVHGFHVTAPAFDDPTCGPQAFDIYIANETAPKMSLDGETWIKVASQLSDTALKDGGTYELQSISRGIPVTHFAIVGRDATCGGLGNEYGIQEIRVYAENDDSGPVDTGPQAPSCVSGGQ